MNTITIAHKSKNKHLNSLSIEYIITRIRDFEKENRNHKRNTGKTQFMKRLAEETGTSLSNIYRIRQLSKVTLMKSDLSSYEDYSAEAVINRYSDGRSRPNSLKKDKAAGFIKAVTEMIKTTDENGNKRYTLDSIDEAVHALKMDFPDLYGPSVSICTKTFYTYVHKGLVPVRPMDLPRMSKLRRSGKTGKDKLPLAKRQKGDSIDLRPDISDRSEFGHWEGDLVTGPRDGKKGAYFTLSERKTRPYIMIPIPSKSARNVLNCVNSLAGFFGDSFPDVFRTITFDNGNEFASWRKMERDPDTGERRTKVYFAHPYCSFERGSNENCNGLIRRFIKKGTDIGKLSRETCEKINRAINKKRRKINGYLSSDHMFRAELRKLGIPESKADFYEFIRQI